MSFAETDNNYINYKNITYISYPYKGGTACIHFIGGETIDVTFEEVEEIIHDADRESIWSLRKTLEGRLDDVIRTIAERA